MKHRWNSSTFRQFFVIILIVEVITIGVASLLLNRGISSWIHQRTTRAIQLSQLAAKTGGWDRIPDIKGNGGSSSFEAYEKKLSVLSGRYFGNETGEIYLDVVDHGESYETYPDDPYPMQDIGKAAPWEIEAYQTGKTTWNTTPHSDNSGTYLAAFTPVKVNGKVVGLVAAEYDTAPFADFQGIVQTAFWSSLIPAALIALIAAYLLAGIFIEPMELFRKIEAARDIPLEGEPRGSGAPSPLAGLTDREREVADLVRQGLRNKEIAERIFVSPETVKQHLKNIREKTGFNKIDLAVHVEANRLRFAQQTAT